MEEKLPIKRLSRLTCLQSIIIGFIFYLVVYNSGTPDNVIPLTLLTMSGILLVGFADIFLMIGLAKDFSIRSKKFSLYRYLLTYPVSVLIYLLLRPCFSYVSGKAWSFWDAGSLLAFVGSGIVVNTLTHSGASMQRRPVRSRTRAPLIGSPLYHCTRFFALNDSVMYL